MHTGHFLAALTTLCVGSPSLAHAQAAVTELRFGAMFASHGVIQRDTALEIWGDAAPRARLTVTLAGRQVAGRADEAGHWRVALPPLAAGGPYALSVADDAGHVVALDDVMIGDVWLCGGQSNMEMRLGAATNAWNEIRSSANPALRFATIEKALAPTPRVRFTAPVAWKVVGPNSAGEASAVCYQMAKALQAATKVPIGFVNASWGGTAAEGWIAAPDLRALKRFDAGLDLLDRYARTPEDPAVKATVNAPWTASDYSLSVLYNGMIAPLAGYRFKGVAWYQGESNWRAPRQYAELLPALIANWRRTLGDTRLPFLVVQLPGFGALAAQPGDSAWPILRDMQRRVVDATANTALVVTLDVGDRFDIHPSQKAVVGERLAQAARRLAYGQAVVAHPYPRGVRRVGSDLVIDFAETDGPLKTIGGDHALGFEACSAASDCHWAEARVAGAAVVLTGANRAEVAKVRYAWADAPVVNLFGGSNLPPGTFELPVP
ncbi:sialate O-acetylesterase [Sphingomonas hengshuiensis]|uniref:Sialate O-acetylesterase domain-containing protein n=1 Tax=Sphingomonas hengshuiensis TaxID=1609977 RepID=A0A7U5BEH8_9SPHN|nr:sialate O-acetylesterase [Sphingomonas hengshuiensis]AJP70764.1 hypothetical protein TS85_01370 [Sphingomonas hengshuiensis]